MIDFQFLSSPENAKVVIVALTKTYDELNAEDAPEEGMPWNDVKDLIGKHIPDGETKPLAVEAAHQLMLAQSICNYNLTRNAIATYNESGIPASDFAFCLLYAAANFDAITEETKTEENHELGAKNFLRAAGFAYSLAQIALRNMKRHAKEIPAKDH